MSRHWIVHAVATCAVALVLLLTVMSCAPVRINGGQDMNMSAEDGGIDMNAVEVDVGENAMATVEPPPPVPAAIEPPPPPPPPPPHPERDGPEDIPGSGSAPHGNYHATASMALPATDTSGEDVDNKPFRGLGEFADPGVMVAEKWHALEFFVGPNQAAIAEEAGNTRLTGAQGIWMAPTMRVTLLRDPDLEVIEQTAAIQDIGLDRTASWKWKVKPLRGGPYTLNALVEILVRGPDGELVRRPDGSLKTQDDFKRHVTFRVRVGAKAKVRGAIEEASWFGEAMGGLFKSWEKMLAALAALIAAAGGVWAAIRKLQGKPVRPRRQRRKKAA